MQYCTHVFGILFILLLMTTGVCAEVSISEATAECLDCHASIHPGIVNAWQRSRHAVIHPQSAMAVEGLRLI